MADESIDIRFELAQELGETKTKEEALLATIGQLKSTVRSLRLENNTLIVENSTLKKKAESLTKELPKEEVKPVSQSKSRVKKNASK